MTSKLFSRLIWRLSLPTALIALSLLSACQTPRYKEFTGIKPGMQKDQVLETAGGPTVSRRWNGKDRWIYNYATTPEGTQTREVHFEDGKAVYVGAKPIPKVTAAEQDRLNEESNVAEDRKNADEQRRWNEEHGVATTLKTGNQLDRQDLRIQKSIYGTSNPRERQQLAPSFESVE